MNDDDCTAIRIALEEMRADFNARIDSVETKVAIHEGKFVSIEESVREIRATAHKTRAELHRLADALTTQSFSVERIERQTKATLDLLQKKVVL